MRSVTLVEQSKSLVQAAPIMVFFAAMLCFLGTAVLKSGFQTSLQSYYVGSSINSVRAWQRERYYMPAVF